MKPFDLLIFTQYPKAYGPRRLAHEAKIKNLRCRIYSYRKIPQKLPEAKCVIFREPNVDPNLYDLRDRLLRFYASNSYILNQRSYTKWPVLDKLTQHQEFEKAGIPHIKLLGWEEAKYPFVVKAKLGSHGDHVFKIENEDDLKSVLAKYKKEDLLFQEFQKAGFDLRAIVLGGKVLGIMKRTPRPGQFLSNYSQGGRVEKLKIKEEKAKILEKIALKIAEHFGLDFVGVDIMQNNNGEWAVLEVNRACQFRGFEKATGVKVAGALISFCHEKAQELKK